MCRGGFAGDPCIQDTDCSPHYYCDKVTSRSLTWQNCVPAKTEKQKCSSDWECQNSYICSRLLSTDAKTCMMPFSIKEGQKSADNRLCQSSFVTSDGICSSIKNVYQANKTSLACNINERSGQCIAVFNYDDSTRSDIIPCQCSLFDASSSCEWLGSSAAARLVQLTQRLYKESNYCSRAYLNQGDPLNLKLHEIKQCTEMDAELYLELVQLIHQWKYSAALASANYKEECLNMLAPTAKTLMT